MRKALLLVAFGLLALGGLTIQSSEAQEGPHQYLWSNAEQTEVFHYPRSGPLVIGVRVNHGIDPQLVADTARSWQTANVELRVVAIGDGSACAAPYTPTLGYIEVCDWARSGVSSPTIRSSVECFYQPSSGCGEDWKAAHKIADVVFVRQDAAVRYTLCHEIGHVLGLGEQWLDGRPRGSCMTTGSSDDWCPSPANLAEVAAVYQHDDGYTTAGPVGATLGNGNIICANGTPIASPTPTPTPPPTSTPTPTAVPPTPVPFCQAHPNHRKCR